MVRLQKYLSEAGVASRRASEEIIVAGRVRVNGQIVQTLGTKIQPGRDQVEVDGHPVKARRKLYVALNKPPGFLCTRNDPLERRTASDLLPAEWQHLSHGLPRLPDGTVGPCASLSLMFASVSSRSQLLTSRCR